MKAHVMTALAIGVVALVAACGSRGGPAPVRERAAPAANTAAGDAELMGLLSRLSATAPEARGATPLWDRTVSAADYERAYPDRALQRGVTGRVTLDCLIGFDGRLTCDVVSENPGNWGFASAALSLATIMRAGPRMSDGIPSANQTVQLDFEFSPQ